MEIPHAENILEIAGIGERVLTGILAEIGDISRFEGAKAAIFEYIESWYNRRRRHSALDYKTPQ